MRMKLLQTPSAETNRMQDTAIVTIGKINFIVAERFAKQGREIGELMERLAVEKCREIS